MRHALIAGAVAALVLAACDGPRETAGEAQDRAAANAAGTEYKADGPAERVGEAQDRADKAARADVEARQKEIRTQADTKADRLEEQARELRDDAKKQADAVANRVSAR